MMTKRVNKYRRKPKQKTKHSLYVSWGYIAAEKCWYFFLLFVNDNNTYTNQAKVK